MRIASDQGVRSGGEAGGDRRLQSLSELGIARIGRRQLYQAISRRDVHTIKVGRTIRIPRSSLEAWLAEPDHEPAQSVR